MKGRKREFKFIPQEKKDDIFSLSFFKIRVVMGSNNKNSLILVFVVAVFLILLLIFKPEGCGSKEYYRDPIYLNRSKFNYDWYPRANGTIYGYPYRYGGSWSIFSGYPYYDKAY